jgi:hypothetical protein
VRNFYPHEDEKTEIKSFSPLKFYKAFPSIFKPQNEDYFTFAKDRTI